jgi:glycosyltransferase involved in cell wall biosynthesis
MNKVKSVCIAFLGNAFNDTRVTNLERSLSNDGIDVKIISFDWTTPEFNSIEGKTSVYKLVKTGSSLNYYISFARILLKQLRKSNADVFLAGDVYTLPFVYLVSRLKKKRSYYDCRELYPFLAGLRNKKITQTLIKIIERLFIKRVEMVITTGPMDAQFIQHYYKITNPIVLRNLPEPKKPSEKINLRSQLGINEDEKILLYQGVLFEGRGLEKTIKALKDINNTHLIMLGSGHLKSKLEQLAIEENVADRIHFLGTIPQEKLINYTSEADFGLALIENISLSYYYALPNKMFEYITAGVPVISCMLPQMKDIIDTYKVGWIIDIETNNLAEKLNQIIDQKIDENLADRLKFASEELNWDVEYAKVKNQLFA